jgi:hypothetical protein
MIVDNDAGQDFNHAGHRLDFCQDDIVNVLQVICLDEKHGVIPPVYHERVCDTFQVAQLKISSPAIQGSKLNENESFHWFLFTMNLTFCHWIAA